MRDNWHQVALREIATQEIDPFDVDPDSRYVNLGVQWYAQGVFARSAKRGSEMKATRLFRVQPGQFIYNRMFVTEGSFGVVQDEHAAGVVSNEFPVFTIDSTRVLTDYFALYFQQPHVWERAAGEATGTTKSRRRWKEAQFLAHTVALPPIDEQRRIVDLVAAIDDAMQAAEGEAAVAREAVSAYRRAILADSMAGHCTVGDVARVVTGRTFKAEHQGKSSGVLPYFRISDMTLPGNERQLNAPADWLDEAGIAAVKPVVCPPGTVVFPILGAALATEKRRVLGVEAGFVQHMIGLVPGPRVRSGWLLAVMQETRLADVSQNGAMPSVNQSHISGIDLPLPDLATQDRLIDQLASFDASADAARATADALRALRANLLTVLLSGEHEIPASYDRFLKEAAA